MATDMTLQLGDYKITTMVTNEPWCENCYLVHHIPSAEQILIDPGDGVDNIIKTMLDKGGYVKKILVTHAHHDHVVAVGVLHRRFNIPCYLHRADAHLMRQAHTYALVFDGKHVEPFTTPCLYEDKEVLEIGGQQIQMIHTPGHTAGSVCYHFGDFVFTGDTVVYQHVGRTDTPGSDIDQLVSSVSCLVKQLPGETLIFPGHGRMWTIREAQDWWRNAITSPPQYKRFGGI